MGLEGDERRAHQEAAAENRFVSGLDSREAALLGLGVCSVMALGVSNGTAEPYTQTAGFQVLWVILPHRSLQCRGFAGRRSKVSGQGFRAYRVEGLGLRGVPQGNLDAVFVAFGALNLSP